MHKFALLLISAITLVLLVPVPAAAQIGPVKIKFVLETPVINLQLGQPVNLLVLLENPTAAEQKVPLHIGSSTELRNWIWFLGHERDEFRRDLNVTILPNDKFAVTVRVLPGKVGSFDLVVGPNETAVYDSKLLAIAPGPAGLFGVAPDLNEAAFVAIIIIAAVFALRGPTLSKRYIRRPREI